MTPAYIAALRKRAGLTQAKLGRLCNVHWVTVSRWERGELAPDDLREALLSELALLTPFQAEMLVHMERAYGLAFAWRCGHAWAEHNERGGRP